jgi:hypothetical protein
VGCGLRDQRGEFPDVGDADGCGGDAVVAIPMGEHDQFTRRMPRDAEELVGPECLGHQDSLSLVLPRDPHATTFVAGEPLVNPTHDVFLSRLATSTVGSSRDGAGISRVNATIRNRAHSYCWRAFTVMSVRLAT